MSWSLPPLNMQFHAPRPDRIRNNVASVCFFFNTNAQTNRKKCVICHLDKKKWREYDMARARETLLKFPSTENRLHVRDKCIIFHFLSQWNILIFSCFYERVSAASTYFSSAKDRTDILCDIEAFSFGSVFFISSTWVYTGRISFLKQLHSTFNMDLI